MTICPECETPNAEGLGACKSCHASLQTVGPWCLEWLHGPLTGQRVALERSGLKVGRSSGMNQLVIQDPEVSRQHAQIEIAANGAARLVDPGSPNGCFVNGKRAQEAVLQPGDVVRFGAREENSFLFAEASAVHKRAAQDPQPKGPMPAAVSSAAASRPTIFMMATDQEDAPPGRRLQLILDQYAVRDIPVTGARLEFGRVEAPGRLQIDHPSVSPRHAELVNGRDGAILRDLKSEAGTRVNGVRIAEKKLEEGDLLQFGNCETHVFLFRETRARANVLRDVELKAPLVKIGRAETNDIRLEHPTISGQHAEVRRVGDAFELTDLGSTNGTFVNGVRITKQMLKPRDRISLGAVQFVFDGAQMEQQSDGTRIRLTARDLRVEAKDFRTGELLRLLNDVSLVFEPREFIGLLGPSGAGKSTLMDALNGSRPAQYGKVLLNNADLYREYDSLRTQIGYLPQEDILHRQLTVRECLYYSAKLRLPDDFGEAEIAARVDETMQMLDLTERADLAIAQLSGGQRKRVSLGIELLNKPALLFVDEPTAGQDPRTEMKMMQLFREIANRGSTVVINTHLLGSFSLLDKVAVLVRGQLAYFGGSQEMMPYFEARRPHEIYDRLQEKTPDEWAAAYRASETWRDLAGSGEKPAASKTAGPQGKASQARHSAWRQWMTLVSRQFTLRLKDKATIAAILAPPIAIAALAGMMSQTPNEPRMLFLLVLVSLWFGCSAAVREIVDEMPVYLRERQRELKISSYLGSKLVWLAAVAVAQAVPFVAVLMAMGAIQNHILTCVFLTWLMTLEGALIGLLISASFSTAEKALYVFPLTMIPQLLLAGLLMPVTALHPFYLDKQPGKPPAIRDIPAQIMPAPMGSALHYGLSPLMVSRWGLEALTDVYVRDNEQYSYELLNSVAITLHPRAADAARARLEQMVKGQMPAPERDEGPPWSAYLAILAAFGVVSIGATAGMLSYREKHGR
ncbi:MAG: FHA domain-containing protein [Acidobacteriaceae bacterium]